MQTRPMLDRVKTSVFDQLCARLEVPGRLPPVRVLDLFAGSGALGLEALSRGAAHCCFVENARPALASLRANIRTTGCDAESRVFPADAFRVPIKCPWGGTYGVCFLDPPYRFFHDSPGRARILGLLERLADSQNVHPRALILFRCEADIDWPETPHQTAVIDRRTYGRMAVWWIQVCRPVAPGPEQDAQTEST